jgi:hypothetical protein
MAASKEIEGKYSISLDKTQTPKTILHFYNTISAFDAFRQAHGIL